MLPEPRLCRGGSRGSHRIPARLGRERRGATRVKAAALGAEGYGAAAVNVVLRLCKQKNVRLREPTSSFQRGGSARLVASHPARGPRAAAGPALVTGAYRDSG